jgi:hypothetical protein
MSLLDKYIFEIGKKLPQKNRIDLQTEIRSTIEDMLEDRSRTAKRPVNDEMIKAVLIEYGSPAKVAAAYHPTRYLISPQLYPFFTMVVKIVLTVLFAVTFAGFAFQSFTHSTSGTAFLASLGEFVLQFLTGATSGLGSIVIVFFILERVLPASEFDDTKESWDPSDLEAEPDPHEVKRGEMIFEILFTVIGLIFINLYPHIFKSTMLTGGVWIFFPPLSDAFLHYLPWINLLAVLGLVLDVFLLRQGSWQTLSHLAGLVLDVSGILLAGIMLAGPSLINFSINDLAGKLSSGAENTLASLIHLVPVIVLVICIIVQSIEVIQKIIKLINQKTAIKPIIQ